MSDTDNGEETTGRTMGDAMNPLTKEFGDIMNDTMDNVKPVNILYAVIPALIVSFIIVIIMLIYIPLTGQSVINVCQKDGENCRNVAHNNMWNILWIIGVPLVVGVIISGITYNILWAYKNPSQYAHQAAVKNLAFGFK